MDIFLRLKMVWLFVIGFVTLTLGCATLEDQEARYGSDPPVITATFAKDRIVFGDTWKIYVNAFDADGDMDSFVCSILQDGRHPYPFDIIKIKPGQRKELSGYLYLPTNTPQDLWGIHIELSLYIVDKAGHKSNEKTFELRFESKASDKEMDRALFDDMPLGPIMIDITNLVDIGTPNTPEQ
ncbi:MAG: hypothetical protein HY739_04080 [Desulfobacterales bacterium]|nr:hypothetical protein [Desulfobacterales bacterium]